MPKSKSSRKARKGRRAPQRTITPSQTPARVVAQPVAVAEAGEAPTLTKTKEASAPKRVTRRDYSYVRRDIQRMVVLAAAVLATIVVLSFFLP